MNYCLFALNFTVYIYTTRAIKNLKFESLGLVDWNGLDFCWLDCFLNKHTDHAISCVDGAFSTFNKPIKF